MRYTIVLLAVLIACILPTPARAGAITVTDMAGISVSYYSPVTGSDPRFGLLGAVRMSGGSGLGPGVDGRTFEAYCVDILTSIFVGGTPGSGEEFYATAGSMADWDAYPGRPSTAGAYASWLYEAYARDIADRDDFLGRAALQVAIWEVLYDTGLSITTGDFRVSDRPLDAAVRTRAQEYLTFLGADPGASHSDATWLKLRACAEPGCADIQDFVGPDRKPAPVPEAPSGLLLALGIAAVAAARLGL